MPRPGPRRRNIGMKLSDAGISWLEERARDEGFVKGDGSANVSAFLRHVLVFAQHHLPSHWQPDADHVGDGARNGAPSTPGAPSATFPH